MRGESNEEKRARWRESEMEREQDEDQDEERDKMSSGDVFVEQTKPTYLAEISTTKL